MTNITREDFPRLLPLASQWAEQQEQHILKHGRLLIPDQVPDARAVGVAAPERVRLPGVAAMPVPVPPALRAAPEATQGIPPFAPGLTLRHGILTRVDCRGD